MKRLLRILGIALLVLLVALGVGAAFWIPPAAEVSASYAAKIACSGIFVAGRDPAQVIGQDLWFLPWVSVAVDREAKSVTVRSWGVERRAVWRDGLGSALVLPGGPDEAALRAQALPPRAPGALEAMARRPWPLGDAGIDPTATARAHGIDEAKLAAALDEAFREPNGAQGVRRLYTRAIVVIHDGEVVAERYGEGFGADTPLLGWSMSKSVLHALIGMRVAEGKMSLSQSHLLPEWERDGRAAITLDQMLRMSPGLAFTEEYYMPWCDADVMLFRSVDAGGFAATRPAAAPPDGTWLYSSGTTNMLSKVLRASFGGDDAAYRRYPRERLYDRLGMRGALAETDPGGSFVFSSFTYATARDWARFGLLYLNDGVVAGERLLPEGWVEYAHTPTKLAPDRRYGAHWWLNAGGRLAGVPSDMYFAGGFQHQSVCVIPSRKTVVVRLGLTMPPLEVDEGALCGSILAAFPPARP